MLEGWKYLWTNCKNLACGRQSFPKTGNFLSKFSVFNVENNDGNNQLSFTCNEKSVKHITFYCSFFFKEEIAGLNIITKMLSVMQC